MNKKSVYALLGAVVIAVGGAKLALASMIPQVTSYVDGACAWLGNWELKKACYMDAWQSIYYQSQDAIADRQEWIATWCPGDPYCPHWQVDIYDLEELQGHAISQYYAWASS